MIDTASNDAVAGGRADHYRILRWRLRGRLLHNHRVLKHQGLVGSSSCEAAIFQRCTHFLFFIYAPSLSPHFRSKAHSRRSRRAATIHTPHITSIRSIIFVYTRVSDPHAALATAKSISPYLCVETARYR